MTKSCSDPKVQINPIKVSTKVKLFNQTVSNLCAQCEMVLTPFNLTDFTYQNRFKLSTVIHVTYWFESGKVMLLFQSEVTFDLFTCLEVHKVWLCQVVPAKPKHESLEATIHETPHHSQCLSHARWDHRHHNLLSEFNIC